MSIRRRLIAILRWITGTGDPVSHSSRAALADRARDATRIADARLPPHSTGLPY